VALGQVDCVRRGLLGRGKDEFASGYCQRMWTGVGDANMRTRLYRSGGARLSELNTLLLSTIMVRRRKAEVAAQLPLKRRQVVHLPEPPPLHKATLRLGLGSGSESAAGGSKAESEAESEAEEEGEEDRGEMSSSGSGGGIDKYHATGLRKLGAAMEWLRDVAFREGGATAETATDDVTAKWVVFAHHRDVMDTLQAQVLEPLSGADGRAAYIRIDGSTDPQDRHTLLGEFRRRRHLRVALVSVTAGGVGLDFSVAANVVFVELPTSVALVEQVRHSASASVPQ